MKKRTRLIRSAAALGLAATAVAGTASGAAAHDDDDESQRFRVTITNRSDRRAPSQVGTFTTPIGGMGDAPAFPGEAYEFSFTAAPGDRLSLATMFVQSNDWLFATRQAGIPLYPGGSPLSGDITGQIRIIDAGTEIDQPIGSGPDQAPRQAGPNTGADDPDDDVRRVRGRNVANYLTVTVTPGADGLFTVRLDNVSGVSTIANPISPGVYAVHDNTRPIYRVNTDDKAPGLESLAEDGDPSALAAYLESQLVVTTPLAPGVFAIDQTGDALFTPGTPDRGDGLEGLAEDGTAGPLGTHLAATLSGDSGVFAVPQGAAGPGPAFPGDRYVFEFEASPGDELNFATMLVQSNDWIFSPAGGGIELFDDDGDPIRGNISDDIAVYDAGTEVDQPLGWGADQAPRQAGPDTGASEGGLVEQESIDASDYVRVRIRPIG